MALACLLAACGGRVAGADGGADPSQPDGSTSTGPASGTTGTTNCPLLAPEPGSACAYPGTLTCRYVGGGIPCQEVTCGNDGQWIALHGC